MSHGVCVCVNIYMQRRHDTFDLEPIRSVITVELLTSGNIFVSFLGDF